MIVVPALPKIEISPEAYRAIWAFVVGAKGSEISGLGEVEVAGDSSILVTEHLYFFKQRGSAGHTDLDMDDVGTTITDAMRNGRRSEDFRFWFHSHPDSVFYSHTDEKTIESLLEFMPFVVAACFNSDGSRYARRSR